MKIDKTEVGILQKKILAFQPCYARIKILKTMNDMEGYLKIPMPLHLSMTYGDIVIPEGTKFIVQEIEDEYKILGFYDDPKPINILQFLGDYLSNNSDKSLLPEDYKTFDYDEIK